MRLLIALLFAFTAYVIFDLSFGSASEAENSPSIEYIWEELITEREKAIMCDAYWTQPYGEVILVIKETVDFYIGNNAADALYVTLNKDCL